MKVRFDRDELLNAITPAAGIANVKNTTPYSNGVLLEFPAKDEPGRCHVCGYDGEKGVRTFIDCTVFEEGSIIIETARFLQIVRLMPAGDIFLTADSRFRVKIEGGASSFEINGTRGEDFPLLPLFAGDRTFTMPQHVLRSLITQSSYCTAVNDTRVAFNGICIDIGNGIITSVGSDGNRIAIASAEMTNGTEINANVIVPTRLVTELLKVVRDSEEDVTVIIARKHIIFKTADFTYFTRMIDASYLDFRKIIPDTAAHRVFINAKQFRESLERANIIAPEKLNGRAYLKLEFEKDILKLSSTSPDGSIYEEIPISLTGDSIKIFFNCKYLLDAMRAVPDGVVTVEIRMNNPLMVMAIEEADRGEDGGESDVKFKYGIMPRRGVDE